MAIKPRHNEAGFTLVEILCVLALLGLTAGLVVLNLPKGEDPFEMRLEKLATQINIAQRDSTIDGKMRGLEVQAEGFDLLQYAGEWEVLRGSDWGDAYKVNLKVENEVIDFKDRAKLLAKNKDVIPVPLIRFDPTEGVTDFELEIQGPERRFILAPDLRGRIKVEPVL